MRQRIIAGNWKMNTTPEEGLKLTREILDGLKDVSLQNTKVILAPPFIHLTAIGRQIDQDDRILLAAQDCHWEASGAYTGEISAAMLSGIDCPFVIIGHSERRSYFRETNEMVRMKVDQALAHQLRPIVCCGESLEIRGAGKHFDWVEQQIKESLFHLADADFERIVIAYEPVWAIGTGKNASPEQAQEIHAFIRQIVADAYNNAIADNLTILYGGSCKPANAASLFEQPDVDGGLIGGASLKAGDFLAIINSLPGE